MSTNTSSKGGNELFMDIRYYDRNLDWSQDAGKIIWTLPAGDGKYYKVCAVTRDELVEIVKRTQKFLDENKA